MTNATRDGSGREYDFVLLLVLVLIATVGAGVLLFHPNVKSIFNDAKSHELATQFFMVAMLGGAVGLAYRFWEMRRADETKRLDKERERRAVQRAALQEFYRSAFTLHHDYKKIRRTLRSLSFCEGQDRKIERLAFEKLMEALEDCQLQAESLHRSVEAQADLFGNEQKNLSSYLSLVDRYLRNLVRQYEEGYQERRQLDPKDLMSLNAEVRSFIDRSEKGDPIWTDLFLPADKVRDSLLELIAKTTPDVTV